MKTHPLLNWRIKHPVPVEDEIRDGDYVVIKEWDVNPSRNAQGQHPKIRRARMNYPYRRHEVRMLTRTPIRVLEVHNGSPKCLYVDMASYLGRSMGKGHHGFMWFLASDVIKVHEKA